MSIREPAGRDDGLVIRGTHEGVEGRQAATGEHEQVRQLALADIEARQRSRFGPQCVQLVALRQSLDHPPLKMAEALEGSRQISEALKRLDDPGEGFGRCLARGVTHNLGMQRLFVRIVDTREVRDLARERLSV